MAKIVKQKNGKYRHERNDAYKPKKGESIILENIDATESNSYVTKLNNGEITEQQVVSDKSSKQISGAGANMAEEAKKASLKSQKDVAAKKATKAAEKAKKDATIEVGGLSYNANTGNITNITPGSATEGQVIGKKGDGKTPPASSDSVKVSKEVADVYEKPLPTKGTSVTPEKPVKASEPSVDTRNLDEHRVLNAVDPEAEKEAIKEEKITTEETQPATTQSSVNNDESGNEVKSAIENPEESNNKEDAKQVEEETKSDPNKLQAFWNAFRSGAFVAYPYLQAIGEAISKNAKMTLDRAALLTGGTRDTSAYDVVNPNDYITSDFKVQSALARAKNNNLGPLSALVASGEVTLENAAAALNMTPEDLQTRFEQTKRTTEAETQSTELTVEEQKQSLIKSNTEMINQINEAINDIDQLIYELKTPDAGYDSYIKAMDAYLGTITGIQSSAGTSSAGESTGAEAGVDASKLIGVKAGADYNKTKDNTYTLTKDLLADQYLDQARAEAESGRKLQGEAANEFIASLEERKRELIAEKNKYANYDKMLNRKLDTSYKPPVKEEPAE